MSNSHGGQVGETSRVLGAGHAIPLASASVAHLARQLSIRALVIKGAVAEELGLRPSRASADVDVLVDPDRFEEFVRALRVRGWHERVHLWLFDHLEEHSTTLIHDQWPVDIDVHRHFPGFLLPPQVVFEQIWTHRRIFYIAHQPITGTDVVAGSAILALHALRWMHTDRNVAELEFLTAYLRSHPPIAVDLVRFAATTGSSLTLGPLINELGLRPEAGPKTEHGEYEAWIRRAAHPSRTGRWVTYFLKVPKRALPRELLKVVWPSRELFRQDHPNVSNTTGALLVARLARLGNGAAGLLQIARLDIRKRLGKRHRNSCHPD